MNTEDTAIGGLRVLDLANEFGVYCGKLLTGMGADVIKVERPGGDATRNIGPFFQDDPHPEKSLFFTYQNTGKRSVTLNLETKGGQEIFRKLTRMSDVIIETFPVGYMARLGLDYPALKKLNPRLVMTSITPFGQTGPHKDWKVSSEIIPLAMGGLMFISGEDSTPPIQMGNFLAGYGVGMYATVGTLAAVHNRWFTDEGGHVDISMQECVTSWLDGVFTGYQYPPYQIITRHGSQHPMVAPCRVYPCKDGYYCCVGSGRWGSIVVWAVDEGIDAGKLIDPKYEAEMRELFEALPDVDRIMTELGMKYNKLELMTEGQKRGIPITIVKNAEEVFKDQHLKAREYFVEVEHPVLGKLKYPGPPYRMMESPWQIGGPAPLVGQHNEVIYSEIGFSKQDLVVLRTEGVI
ncbi:CaiB/BaiF CoA transferase family protein [Chloroflexota bacterium]